MINYSDRMLRAFVAVAECRKFTLAAERCHMSQPALSQMIARLEDSVGTALLERNTRNVTLTSEGELFLSAVRRALSILDEAGADAHDRSRGLKGKVSFAALPSLCTEWLPKIISRYRVRFPGIKLQIFDVVSRIGIEMLRRHEVDFMLSAQISYSATEFESELLRTERFFAVCPRNHPLTARRRVLLEDLTGYDYIHTSRSGGVWPYLEPYEASERLRDTGLEVSHNSTLAGLIANQLGISIAVESALGEFYQRQLAAVPLADKGLRRSLFIVKRKGHAHTAAARSLLEMIREA